MAEKICFEKHNFILLFIEYWLLIKMLIKDNKSNYRIV